MKISVVMAVYNGGERMRRTIESVLSQTWSDFEFLCIDDGSTDDVSGRILDEYAAQDARMVVVHRENKGVCETLNECYRLAKGDFVARTDQDDVFHPRLLEFCKRAVEENNLDFLAFRYKTMFGDSVNQSDEVMPELNKLQVWDQERRVKDSVGYCKALTSIHTDTWAHFLHRDLALRHPFHVEFGLTRLLAQLREPIRWASSPAVLYFYDAGVVTSMTHQPFSVEELMWDMTDINNTMALYSDVIKSGDPFGEWNAVCKAYVLVYLKINYNKIRRCKGAVSAATRRALRIAFAKELCKFFSSGNVSMRQVKFRHRIAYKWLMLQYGMSNG